MIPRAARALAGMVPIVGLAAGLTLAARYARRGAAVHETGPAAAAQEPEGLNPPYDARFHFVRIRFTPTGRGFGRFGGFGRGGRGMPPWMHDYPRAEYHFLRILDETTLIHPHLDGSHILTTDDPELLKYPVAYIVEVGFWNPTEEEVHGLRSYLLKGGFLIVDDFRSPWELDNFEFQMRRVLPGSRLIRLDAGQEIFDTFFRIASLDLAPPTYPQFTPVYYGIFEDNDATKRMMVIVNHNNDVAEYWEWSDRGYYPIDLSNDAYKLGVNYVIYGLTH